MDTARDTMCSGCYKWTHRLTPGGNGIIFCDQYCAYRYDKKHSTSYAFDRYHFIPIGGRISFHTTDEQHAWYSLKYWLTTYYSRPTMETVQREYSIKAITDKLILFERNEHV